jgi:hypothetical protein
MIAQRQGHQVTIHTAGRPKHHYVQHCRIQTYTDEHLEAHFPRMLRHIPWECSASMKTLPDVYICSTEEIKHNPRIIPPCFVAAYKERFEPIERPRDILRADVVLAYATGISDFSEPHGRISEPLKYRKAMQSRLLTVPWRPHDHVTRLFERDGMLDAFIDDDLETIRARYTAPAKVRDVGFAGTNHRGRARRSRLYGGDPHFHFRWTTTKRMLPDDYLRWLSECRIVLGFPGDTWNCSRFCESVVMGSAIVQQRGKINLTPPMTTDNVILVDDWGDKDVILNALEHVSEICAAADRAYKQGWSLRGQMNQIIERFMLSRQV